MNSYCVKLYNIIHDDSFNIIDIDKTICNYLDNNKINNFDDIYDSFIAELKYTRPELYREKAEFENGKSINELLAEREDLVYELRKIKHHLKYYHLTKTKREKLTDELIDIQYYLDNIDMYINDNDKTFDKFQRRANKLNRVLDILYDRYYNNKYDEFDREDYFQIYKCYIRL